MKKVYKKSVSDISDQIKGRLTEKDKMIDYLQKKINQLHEGTNKGSWRLFLNEL